MKVGFLEESFCGGREWNELFILLDSFFLVGINGDDKMFEECLGNIVFGGVRFSLFSDLGFCFLGEFGVDLFCKGDGCEMEFFWCFGEVLI